MSEPYRQAVRRLLTSIPAPGQFPWATRRTHRSGADVNGGSRNSRPVRDHAGSVVPLPGPVPAPAASAAYTTDNDSHSVPAALAVRLLAAAVGVPAGPPRPTAHGVGQGRRHLRQALALHLCFFPAQSDRSPVVGPLWHESQ